MCFKGPQSPWRLSPMGLMTPHIMMLASLSKRHQCLQSCSHMMMLSAAVVMMMWSAADSADKLKRPAFHPPHKT